LKSSEQLNAKLRALSKETRIRPQTLLRFYLMEHLLEKISSSRYKRHFILKGGMLVASIVGIKNRSTMDIDAMINGITVSGETIRPIFDEIAALDSESGIKLSIADIQEIREDAEYTGFRVSINAAFDKIRQNFKVDVSAGDVIAPNAIEYEYPLLLEDRRIKIFAYPLEMVLAEKLETILVRSVANTRMRDFYDVFILFKIFEKKIDISRLKEALLSVIHNRGSEGNIKSYRETTALIKSSQVMAELWNRYAEKNDYAQSVRWQDANETIEAVLNKVLA
jgi:predicted nucleotidyltransferase component of viral defense system